MNILMMPPKVANPNLNPQGVFAVVPHQMSAAMVALPLLGRVAAGNPLNNLDFASGSESTVDVPSSMVGRGDHFVLQVKGDSMLEEGILDGDHVVVRRQQNAVNGQTVVAMVAHEATVKKYFRKGNRVELHPANSEFRPIIVRDLESFYIDGIVVGVIRHLERFDSR